MANRKRNTIYIYIYRLNNKNKLIDNVFRVQFTTQISQLVLTTHKVV